MQENRKTLYLIDGTALIYRAYFAFKRNPLINSKGEDTSAAFGFTNTVLGLLHERSPEYIGVVFDSGKPTFRHELYDQYKATRQKMAPEMYGQIPRVKEALDALGLYQLEMPGFEADDIIGTLALKAADEGFDVIMVTGDKDFMQLVNDRISMFVPMKNEIVTPEGVLKRFGVPPEKIIDLLGLMGDSSDNVPGIPKIGEKTAAELINGFGSLENVLERWSEIKKQSIRESVANNRDSAVLSKKLVAIKTDVPVPCEIEALRFDGIKTDSAREFLRRMEFESLLGVLTQDAKTENIDTVIVGKDNFGEFTAGLEKQNEFSVCLFTDSENPMEADITGMAFSFSGKAFYLPFAHCTDGNLDRAKTFVRLKNIFESSGYKKTAHDAKFLTIALRRQGLDPSPFAFDTMLAAYVIEPGSRNYSLDKLSDVYLKTGIETIENVIGKGKKRLNCSDIQTSKAAAACGTWAYSIFRLIDELDGILEKEDLKKLYYGIEMPLMEVLAGMEMRGVLIDRDILGDMSKELDRGIMQSERKIYETAGMEFNINSPKQLGEILFGKLGLKMKRKTKTGFSTDIDTLIQLSAQHELPSMVLEHRQLSKLKSTYVDALPIMINPETGRVHTLFNQAVAATGRLSSSNPNLQNIPIRSEMGREIRKAFVAPDGYFLLSADYSQIDLRIMAHISKDKVLTDAFLKGGDIHRNTAAVLFGVRPEDVTPDQRRQAKTINFGVMYGMGAHSLSEQLGITRDEAKWFIDNYFQTYSGVREYIEKTIDEAKSNGYVATLMGRKRYLPEINSDNRNVAEFAKRTAINTPIQGSAADLIKISMINLSRKLIEGNLDACMIIQVHDELILETRENIAGEVSALVKDTMENAIKLDIPLVVDIGRGKNWFDAH